MEDVDNSEAAAVLQSESENDKRANNLDILRKYIQRQRSLLELIKLDISSFQTLKKPSQQDPTGTLHHILDRYNNTNNDNGSMEDAEEQMRMPTMELADLIEEVRNDGDTAITDDLDWSLYKGQDSTPLHMLASSTRSSHSSAMFLSTLIPPPPTPGSSKQPSNSQSASSSHSKSPYPPPRGSTLRTFVREARMRIVDPVLKQSAEFLASLPPDSDDESKPKPTNRVRTKSKNGKHFGHALSSRRRKHEAIAGIVRPRGPGGVFVKRSIMVDDSTTPGSSKTKELRLSSVSSVTELDGEHGEGRHKRQRRPSVRLLDSLQDSTYSSLSTGTGRGKGKPKVKRRGTSLSTTASPAPSEAPRVRLTIRIPPLASINSSGAGAKGTQINEPRLHSAETESASVDHALTGRSRISLSTSPEVYDDADVDMNDLRKSCDDDIRSPTNGYSVKEEDKEDGRAYSSVTPHSIKREQSESADWQAYESEESLPAGCQPYECGESLSDTGANVASTSTHTDKNTTYNGDGLSTSKAKSETFKQQWSVSEQHLLDRLLEQFPDGTRNRWSKISKAMDGRRTPRQVASRVQKYFAKLRKFGLDIEGK